MDNIDNINLYKELNKAMRIVGFNQEQIDLIEKDKRYLRSIGANHRVQRVELTLIFNDILVISNLNDPVPDTIRVALSYSTDPLGWLEDVTSTILPFLKINEQFFFNKI